jgi:hypothetical protein
MLCGACVEITGKLKVAFFVLIVSGKVMSPHNSSISHSFSLWVSFSNIL